MLDKLGDFKLLDLLGEGGMGTVYRATQKSLGREVAVKILPERLTQNPRFVQRFYREARSAASLIHPNIIQIFSLGQDEDAGLHYFAMEYVRGKDLSQIVKSGVKFSVEQTITILIQVAEALRVAAEGGIIHRDIKPANIMLTNRGQVKVMDFGLAKMADDSMDVTQAGTIVGTANYMSPEQGQGKELDCRTDIYSLGVVFYELLTGRPPFKAEDPSAVIYMHIYEQPRKPSELNSKVPPAVDRLVLRMMAKSADDRVASPEVLLADLKKLKHALASGQEEKKKAAKPAKPARSRAPERVDAAEKVSPFEKQRLSVIERARSGTVLVCDSSEYLRRMYRASLEAEYAVAAAGSGRECMEVAVEGHPDVLVLDLAVKNPGGFTVLDQLGRKCPDIAVLVITGDRKKTTVERLARYNLAGVLVKPVRLPDLRRKIGELLGAAPEKKKPRAAGSQSFVEEVARQEAVSAAALDVAGLATKLLGRQEKKDVELITRRIRMGSPNQIIGVIREMFGALAEDQAWKLAIYAFKEGDHRVRILTAELAGRRFGGKRAAELLTRFAADTDYRVRIAALRELAGLEAPGVETFLARFLNDESWKVRREAARGLEKRSAGRVLEPLILYYARNDRPPPLYLQRLIKAPNPVEAVKCLESAARKSRSVRVKEFVAGLLGQAGSKTVVPTLLKLLKDEHPAVRTAAARGLAGFPTDLVKRSLFARLTDDRFGVQKAVAETLGVFRLQRATRGLIKLFSSTGRRVPEAAAKFIAGCDAGPEAFESALRDLDAHPEPVRQVLAFVLKRLYEDDAEVGKAVRRLRSKGESESVAAAREAADRLAKFLIV